MSPDVSANHIIAAVCWVAALLCYDRWQQFRKRPPRFAFSVLLAVSIVLTLGLQAVYTLGLRQAMSSFLMLSMLPCFAEASGVKFGIPFGKYRYSSSLGPRLIFGVPVVIVFMWPVMLYTAHLTTLLILPNDEFTDNVLRALLGAAFATLTDFILDPILVARGYWNWSDEIKSPTTMYRILQWKWSGVPAINFVGWFLTSFLTLLIFYSFTPISIELNSTFAIVYLPILLSAISGLYLALSASALGLRSVMKLAIVSGLFYSALYLRVIFV